jgi:hypothetical protein
MSDSIDTTKVGKYQAIQSALCELVSAESSCNMFPEPIPADPTVAVDSCEMRVTPDGGAVGVCTCDPRLNHEKRTRYISESDANVEHALEHMHAAFRLMNLAHHDQEMLKTQVYKLVVQIEQLGAKPCIKTWLDVCSRCNANDVDAVFCTACTAELSH